MHYALEQSIVSFARRLHPEAHKIIKNTSGGFYKGRRANQLLLTEEITKKVAGGVEECDLGVLHAAVNKSVNDPTIMSLISQNVASSMEEAKKMGSVPNLIPVDNGPSVLPPTDKKDLTTIFKDLWNTVWNFLKSKLGTTERAQEEPSEEQIITNTRVTYILVLTQAFQGFINGIISKAQRETAFNQLIGWIRAL
ncbi:hypothetical protein AKO1_009480 [Acrasis kona]|uniref:Uncharacterized protein n=1 Tax=Acrasis kona TaxID=1008807 RepID=A0AAW2ZMQ3_9EUKA